MPNDNENNDLSDLSIEEINKLYSNIIEFPEDVRLSASVNGGYSNGGRQGVCDSK